MSCLSCFQTPCCCPQDNPCSETIQYTAENANLAGIGVFGALEGTMFRFRGIQGVPPIQAVYNNVTKVIEIGFDGTSFKQQATFTDNAARASATPQYLGQLGVQINTGKIYIGTSLVVGGWTIYTP
jgi:hypothetical protein